MKENNFCKKSMSAYKLAKLSSSIYLKFDSNSDFLR